MDRHSVRSPLWRFAHIPTPHVCWSRAECGSPVLGFAACVLGDHHRWMTGNGTGLLSNLQARHGGHLMSTREEVSAKGK
jgi:hypothetical protein